MKRDEGAVVRRSPEEHREPDLIFEDYDLDAVARGLAEGTITRGRAIKLAGAALVGSVLSMFAFADDAEALRIVVVRRRRLRRFRRRCRRRLGARFCKDRIDGTNRVRCCLQPTSNSRCRRGRCGGR